ncbi:MAG: DUF938 domain-containing protein [Kangiellaceae bacterium]|jgi:cyclopropane fatty-acyl-phospholipid synthase-like methyltransferase|nr:DUF938 domain-containing protein [Kangiellaceae bacterium]
MDDLPFSQACENNKDVILQAIAPYLQNVTEVLEIGSGTGQHAVHFAQHLPHLIWQTTDQPHYHQGINAWIEHASLANVRSPLTLDVTRPWPVAGAQAIFSANTTHIMSWSMVLELLKGVGEILETNGYFLLYGPFMFCGEYTSESNQTFDQSLQSQNPAMGLKEFADIEELARAAELVFVEKHDLPANNHLLVWQKSIPLADSIEF